jgi:hypothetical protein
VAACLVARVEDAAQSCSPTVATTPSAPRYDWRILAYLLLLALAVGICVVALRLLGKQRRVYVESQGPPDLQRADDAEDAPPFDPRTLGQVAEDFYAAGARPKWMRGVDDASFTHAFGGTSSTSPNSSESNGDQWEVGDHEGWCPDPFGRHEARWLSGGEPTDLVRDGGVESHDEPPGTQGAGS